MSSVERRRTPRVEMNWDVTVKHTRNMLHGRALNVSEHGMFIALRIPHELLHGAVEVRMYREDVMLCMRGVVVHNDNGGIGLVLREPTLMYELVDGNIYEVTPLAAVA